RDVEVKDDDLDMDEVKRDAEKLAEARKRERDREREEQRKDAEVVGKATSSERVRNLGKKAVLALVVLVVVGAGAIHVVPLSTGSYEQAAAQATGQAVKIGSARYSLISGLEVKLDSVSVGHGVKIGTVRASPSIGSLFGSQKEFSRIVLENAVIKQELLGAALFGTLQGSDLKIGAIAAKQLKLEGPLAVPPLDVDAAIGADGSVQSVRISGPDRLQGQITPRNGELAFEVSAGSFPVPFMPGVTLADFAMKGNATRQGLGIAEFDGRAVEGVFNGNSRIRWGDEWSVEGELRVRGVNVGVFAPALMSEGKVEGSGKYAMKGAEPAKLGESLRLEGSYKVEKGVLGSFDLGRAIQGTGPLAGRTVFNELTGQGLYDKGAVQLRNVAIAAGALNAGAGLEIAPDGALSGRVIVDLKSARATLSLGGKVKEPALRR
ncbi:MAG TPA: hypothetical protein VL280_01055, partial [Burkholderiales bacterium]|nr:hypothetical protein [Burkholderiales bacterium]